MSSQGANSQLLWGFEAIAAGRKAATMYGLRTSNLAFTPKPTFERTKNLDPRGQQQKGRVLKWDLPISFDAEMSVDDLARLRAHHQGFASIASTATGVKTWTIRDLLSSDSLATDISSLSFEGDRDDTYAQLILNAAIEEMTVSVKANKIVNEKFTGMGCRFTHQNDPTFSTDSGSTYTGTLYVRGNRNDSDALDTTNHIKVKCTTTGALDGTAMVKFTVGATSYGSVAYAVTAGSWIPVILADGTHASGDPLDPVMVMFSTGGTLTANDEFTIQGKRVKATPTYPARNPLTAVAAVVTIGGTQYAIEEFDLVFKRPRKGQRALGSKYPSSILKDGNRTFMIKLKRDYVDRALYLKMLSSTAVAFDITVNGDLIATVSSSSYYEKWQLTSTNAQVVQAGADIPNDKQLQESIDIVPYWDGTNVDMTETIVCTLASLS